ncbi:hypothetical protein UFOVP1302_56 [uncultured Caudovirales phage]|uniref:Uncharacterized protein n=1 Tax=uncultured Caudovirales phage TaxID=2100421 RepID=A0A6J5RJF1_9CAUD|nr:hypothetical protein UFOVP895_59 [uncultured Caudovirales phage]CAB4181320.1 hypothetical protein UFOVP1070_28 [uncultured Caudovirales phage]CAB4196122.1 hypothetical protein UFOVP1302_56 [uncultured Caudovirales phage]CAB4211877.1 hypothetical protein UFOVP1416_56 [uncultured Caudovirales phage]
MNMRSISLLILSAKISDKAKSLAADGNTLRAMWALALSEALHHSADGNSVDKRLALVEAKFLGRAERISRRVSQ